MSQDAPAPGYEPSYAEDQRRSKARWKRWRWLGLIIAVALGFKQLDETVGFYRYVLYALIGISLVLIPYYAYQHWEEISDKERTPRK